MKIPKIIKPFVWNVFKIIRTEEGFKVKTFPEGFRMKLDMSEVIDNNLYYGLYEKEITNLFRKIIKPGMTIVDVGANIGYYTLLASRLVGEKGKVYSFEPTIKAYESLCDNIIRNNQYNMVHEKVALDNFNGRILKCIRSSYKIKDPFDEETWDKYAEEEFFDLRTLDSFNIKKIDLIKIDVDGNEVKVLEGALETIRKCKPLILIEIHKDNMNRIKELLKGYKIVPINYNETERFNNYICKYLKGGKK